MENKAQIDIRLILGIFVIIFGALGIGSLGIGIMINNNAVAWFGGVIAAVVGIAASTIQEFLK